MPLCLIGKKLGMIQYFTEEGTVTPVTVLEVGPCPVVQVKTEQTDKYNAVQLAFGEKKASNVSKPLTGHFKKAGVVPKRHLLESRIDNVADYTAGQDITVDVFEKGDYVDITGTSKGHGFTGVVKRHGFKGGKRTHGSKNHRAPGSIGMAATPARVLKGTKLPGQMGNVRKTDQNLEVIDVRADRNQLFIKGSVPGATDSIVYVRKSKKKSSKK
jgi:large subunit ribosomal protein L3